MRVDHPGVHQVSQDIHEGNDVVVMLNAGAADQARLRLRVQPESHLGDHAVVRLREYSVHKRPGSILELLPGLRGRQGAHAGAHHLSVGQHDLHPAVRVEVVAIGQWRTAGAAVNGVADRTAPPWLGAVNPELQLFVTNIAVEVEVTHAGLYQSEGVFFADLENAVHAFEIKHNAAGKNGCRAAIREVASRRNGIERNGKLVRDADDPLNLLHRVRTYRS